MQWNEQKKNREMFLSLKDYGVSNTLMCVPWVKRKSSERPLLVCDCPICYVQLHLRRKMRLYLPTIYTCGRLLSVSSSTKKEKEQKMLNDFEWETQEVCVVWFFVTISITISLSFFFLVDVILVIHVSYYITVYLNDVKSCIWFGHMCVRRRCESQYRKMLYFCYEIY